MLRSQQESCCVNVAAKETITNPAAATVDDRGGKGLNVYACGVVGHEEVMGEFTLLSREVLFL